ncbi:MAG: hypothetical protein Q4D38_10840 [Planctomycetia bacterium]|nr:hypothetical protein [Planctomycetia bacterium]
MSLPSACTLGVGTFQTPPSSVLMKIQPDGYFFTLWSLHEADGTKKEAFFFPKRTKKSTPAPIPAAKNPWCCVRKINNISERSEHFKSCLKESLRGNNFSKMFPPERLADRESKRFSHHLELGYASFSAQAGRRRVQKNIQHSQTEYRVHRV